MNAAPASEVPPIVHDVLRSPGQPLDAATRAFMEPRFGHDFSQVRVRMDTRAAESARAVNALAYTVGRDMVFGAGQYSPSTSASRKLIAHGLTHVVQQSRTTELVSMARCISSAHHLGYEQEASEVANAVVADTQVGVRERAPQGTIQRAGPAAAAPAIGVLVLRCVIGMLASMALDAAIQYGMHLWRLRRWPWERARETWESYRHNWCMMAVSAVLGCFGGVVVARWLEPFLRSRYPGTFGGAAGGTLLGHLLMGIATRGLLAPRMVVKWLARFGCIALDEAESLYPGITRDEAIAEAPAGVRARPGEAEASA